MSLTAGTASDIKSNLIRRRDEDFQGRKKDVIAGNYELYIRGVLGYDFTFFHRMIFEHQLKNRWTLVIASRNFGKSVLCNTAYSTYKVNMDKNIRIGIASRTLPKAQKLIRLARKHYEDNEVLREVSGISSFRESSDESWSASELTVVGRTEFYPEATLTAMGMQGALVSNHFDIIIPDDVVDETNKDGAGSEELITRINKELVPMLNPFSAKTGRGGELHFIGTRFSDEDAYQFLIDSKQFAVLVVPCYMNRRTMKFIRTLDEIECAKSEGELESVWPQRISVEELEKRRQLMGNGDFFSQYMGDVSMYQKSQDDRFFMENVREYDDLPEGVKDARKIGCVDLSTGKESGDFFVAGVACATGNKPIYLVDVIRDKIERREQIDMICSMQDSYKCSSWFVEGNGDQYTIVSELERRGVPVQVFYTKQGKKARFRKLRGVLDYRGLRYRHTMRAGIRELKDYPNCKNDDFIDFLDFVNANSDFEEDYGGQYEALKVKK